METKIIVFRACCYAITEMIKKGSSGFCTFDLNDDPHVMKWPDVAIELKKIIEERD